MPYPMAPALTFAELKKRLIEEFGCELKTKKFSNDFSIVYIERAVYGKTVKYTIEVINENDIVYIWLISNICRRLKINPALFGCDLDRAADKN